MPSKRCEEPFITPLGESACCSNASLINDNVREEYDKEMERAV